jgi:pre-mRNA-splicing factor RBM22/SLT11
MSALANRQDSSNEFPVLCSDCLGPNPYIRMTKRTLGEECRLCTRVYTGFSWKQDKSSRHGKTQICPVCATMKNLCQCCVLDLEFKLPSYVRDSILPEQEQAGTTTQKSELSRVMTAEQAEKMISEGGVNKHLLAGETAPRTDTVLRLARSAPYMVRGLQESTSGKLRAPEDMRIKTLYVGGLEKHSEIDEKELRTHFESFGQVQSIKIARQQGSAYITFDHRTDAENAADGLHNKLVIRGVSLRLLWAKPKDKKTWKKQQQQRLEQEQAAAQQTTDAIAQQDFSLAPPPGEDEALYPSLRSAV